MHNATDSALVFVYEAQQPTPYISYMFILQGSDDGGVVVVHAYNATLQRREQSYRCAYCFRRRIAGGGGGGGEKTSLSVSTQRSQ